MRSMEETQLRWEATRKHCTTVAHLQRAVTNNGPSSPCLSGCRSVCWKTFLLFQETGLDSWIQTLRHTRETYAERRQHFLKFIRHPEALAEISSDPLNDDPESPWNTLRQDELMRAEIEQDVKRLPDEANYHQDSIQLLILDVLFIYCKLNPARGGYRQGMHELLAPIVHVLEQDAVSRESLVENGLLDVIMLETLDAAYIEHDAYAIFSKLMERAQFFYEVKEVVSGMQSFQEVSSAIVERSKHVHQVLLHRIDPDLAAHLTNIEILPQIFLIRWIRLLFSREFPFNQFLILWDTIFAVDPSLDLIDFVSCAMLLRIRWQLLEADYSVCLQLLLKYPAPDPQHGPHTFVDDAIYLRSHPDFPGGAHIIAKYTDRTPATPGASATSPTTTAAARRGLESIRQRALRSGGPQGVEQFIQGAAKSARAALERGEKLGINQAVREAMGELRRNMQNLNDARVALPRPSSQGGGDAATAALDKRNKQLANFLNETVADLKALSASSLEDKAKSRQMLEVAAAKVQFVQIYLEDSTMDVPLFQGDASRKPQEVVREGGTTESAKAGKEQDNVADQNTRTPSQAQAKSSKRTEADAPSAAPEKLAPANQSKPVKPTQSAKLPLPGTAKSPAAESRLETGQVAAKTTSQTAQHPTEGTPSPPTEAPNQLTPPKEPSPARPQLPAVPTRSTIAQSSFSWMLEPGESTPSAAAAAAAAAAAGSKSPQSPQQSKKQRGLNNLSRERNAFLFGDGDEGSGLGDPLAASGIFGLEPMSKVKGK
ncbi:WD repeat domain-containing protein [Beauveria bassiana ARSEF 2860]|uniref:WD repeat domain-containing protein n=1 Tax=Beauveria bassiana (strain ARSEF 2860) TaxID=655819 RepID=J5JDC7_BEAB2|nr:WD repeat domain-containing protein [Beauveria bassiana ARSEF 2860]EJP61781.1 WD repeat domain-containing protein [Beauveria bassiana ARSEF 2860]